MMSPGFREKIFWASFARETRFMLRRLFRSSTIDPRRSTVPSFGFMQYTGKARMASFEQYSRPIPTKKESVALSRGYLFFANGMISHEGKLFPALGRNVPPYVGMKFRIPSSPAKERGFSLEFPPALPSPSSVPDRQESVHNHRQHDEETDPEKRPEQDIQHGCPLCLQAGPGPFVCALPNRMR